jgi:hypothetical protein
LITNILGSCIFIYFVNPLSLQCDVYAAPDPIAGQQIGNLCSLIRPVLSDSLLVQSEDQTAFSVANLFRNLARLISRNPFDVEAPSLKLFYFHKMCDSSQTRFPSHVTGVHNSGIEAIVFTFESHLHNLKLILKSQTNLCNY